MCESGSLSSGVAQARLAKLVGKRVKIYGDRIPWPPNNELVVYLKFGSQKIRNLCMAKSVLFARKVVTAE
jgi:hypothetical protein